MSVIAVLKQEWNRASSDPGILCLLAPECNCSQNQLLLQHKCTYTQMNCGTDFRKYQSPEVTTSLKLGLRMTKKSVCLCPDMFHPSWGVTKASSTLLTYVNEIKQTLETTTGSSPHVSWGIWSFSHYLILTWLPIQNTKTESRDIFQSFLMRDLPM